MSVIKLTAPIASGPNVLHLNLCKLQLVELSEESLDQNHEYHLLQIDHL